MTETTWPVELKTVSTGLFIENSMTLLQNASSPGRGSLSFLFLALSPVPGTVPGMGWVLDQCVLNAEMASCLCTPPPPLMMANACCPWWRKESLFHPTEQHCPGPLFNSAWADHFTGGEVEVNSLTLLAHMQQASPGTQVSRPTS